MPDILLDSYHLRAHPFAPEVDPSGNEIDPDALLRTLDPRTERSLLRYYFDLYDWGDVHAGLSEAGRIRGFSALDRAFRRKEPHLLVICGDGETGRRSLKNLVLYEAAQALGAVRPIVVDVDLGGHRKLTALDALCLFTGDEIVAEAGAAVSDEAIRRIHKDARDAAVQSADIWNTAFQRLGRELRKAQRPVIMHLEGAEHADTWEMIYDAARFVAPLIVITTANADQALTLRRVMGRRSDKHIALVQAGPLTFEDAGLFLRSRIRLYRADDPDAPVPETAPFDPAAIGALYEVGSDAVAGTVVAHPIRWLSETFRWAIDRHLERIGAEPLAAEAPIPLISAADIIRYRDEQNEGH